MSEKFGSQSGDTHHYMSPSQIVRILLCAIDLRSYNATEIMNTIFVIDVSEEGFVSLPAC